MPETLNFKLGPTQLAFVQSTDQIVQLMGPMGEGKTFAGAVALPVHARRCGMDIRCAIMRDTFQNIKTSTIPDLQDYFKSWIKFSDGMRKAIITTKPKIEIDLFGIDDEASISKLQGPQYALVWLEEPAPIFEKANAGLPKEVLNLAIARAARQRGRAMRVQITQNPADEEHWSEQFADEPHEYAAYTDPDTGEVFTIFKTTFRIPPGENKMLSGMTRAALYAAFHKDPAKKKRYIEGEAATVSRGKAVTPAYAAKIHLSNKVLPVLHGEAISLWDGWHHPSCIICQYNPEGQLIVHDCFSDDSLTGVEDLISDKIKPRLLTPKYKDKIKSFRAIGDPTIRTPDQSSRTRSAATFIENFFQCRFEPGPVRWPLRRESVNSCFKKLLNGGQPAVLLSASAQSLHKALRGGWHYKTDNSGRVSNDKPEKDANDHLGMAFSYGMAVLMPDDIRKKLKEIKKEDRMRTALSYRGGNFSVHKSAVNRGGVW